MMSLMQTSFKLIRAAGAAAALCSPAEKEDVIAMASCCHCWEEKKKKCAQQSVHKATLKNQVTLYKSWASLRDYKPVDEIRDSRAEVGIECVQSLTVV